MPTDKQIKHTVLRKMLYHGYIGGKHTSVENLPKGFPKDCRKKVNKIVDNMIKDGYFKLKPKPDSLHVSLEPTMLKRIKDELSQQP
jgi:hypothetical protein